LDLAEDEEGFKRNSLNGVAALFKCYPYKITSAAECKDLKGVGKSTLTKIEAFFSGELTTGNANQPPPLESVEEKTTPLEDQILAALRKTGDDGEGSTAEDLVAAGVQATVGAIKESLLDMIEAGSVYNTIDSDHVQNTE
jgi:hypothetical protein